MLLTPRLNKRNITQGTTASHLSQNFTGRLTDRSSMNRSSMLSWGSNKSIQNTTPITKMSISIKKKKMHPSSPTKNIPITKINPAKFRANVNSKMSTQSCGPIRAYGISTYKGYKNITNPHHIGIHLGFIKNLMLVEGYDGNMAGKIVKQTYPIQLMKLTNKQMKDKPQRYIKEAFDRTQEELTAQQNYSKDNSGASLISLVMSGDIITIANTGASQVFCLTKNGSLLALNQQHTTQNKKQLERVVRNGGKIYKSVVNVPNQQQLTIQGPIRIFPSGLFYTRAFGKTLDSRCQERDFQNIFPRRQLKKQQRKITWVPQTNFIKTEEIVWLGIFSQSVVKNISQEQINQVIHSEYAERNGSYTDHHIAMESSRKIVNKVIAQGVPEAISAMIFLFNSPISSPQTTSQSPRLINKPQKLNRYQKAKIKKENILQRPSSLKYIGNRKSFVKDTSQGNHANV